MAQLRVARELLDRTCFRLAMGRLVLTASIVALAWWMDAGSARACETLCVTAPIPAEGSTLPRNAAVRFENVALDAPLAATLEERDPQVDPVPAAAVATCVGPRVVVDVDRDVGQRGGRRLSCRWTTGGRRRTICRRAGAAPQRCPVGGPPRPARSRAGRVGGDVDMTAADPAAAAPERHVKVAAERTWLEEHMI